MGEGGVWDRVNYWGISAVLQHYSLPSRHSLLFPPSHSLPPPAHVQDSVKPGLYVIDALIRTICTWVFLFAI